MRLVLLVLFGMDMIVVCFRIGEIPTARLAVHGLVLLLLDEFVGLLLQDSPLEFVGCDRWQLGYFSFQVVPVPVGLVMRTLEFRVFEGHSAGNAGECR